MSKDRVTSGGRWETYKYYEVYGLQFTASECEQIIGLHNGHMMFSGRMSGGPGRIVRDSDLFWIPRSGKTDWIFSRLEAVLAVYNSKYGFELATDLGQAQLTCYRAGQHYDWHMDLGSGQSSLRKVTLVAELTGGIHIKGGGIEIFHGERENNRVNLGIGDVVIFPSFVMHRAAVVHAGIRWSLVLWATGTRPLN